jgi:hypothetical protein
MAEQTFDLFGAHAVAASPRLGRPRHVPTLENRRKVSALAGLGVSHLKIAHSIGLTAPTLRAYYFLELNSSSQVWRRRLPEGKDRQA